MCVCVIFLSCCICWQAQLKEVCSRAGLEASCLSSGGWELLIMGVLFWVYWNIKKKNLSLHSRLRLTLSRLFCRRTFCSLFSSHWGDNLLTNSLTVSVANIWLFYAVHLWDNEGTHLVHILVNQQKRSAHLWVFLHATSLVYRQPCTIRSVLLAVARNVSL